MGLSEKKKELVELFMKKEILLSPEFVEYLNSSTSDEQVERILNLLSSNENGLLVVNKEIEGFLSSVSSGDFKLGEFEEILANLEKKNSTENYTKVISALKEDVKKQIEENKKEDIDIEFSYEDNPSKKNMQSFISYFNKRYVLLKNILQNRQELERASAINRIKMKKERENIAIIGMVRDISKTKNGNIIVTLEDPSGDINVLFNKTKTELFEEAAYIVLDEVIGVTGVVSNGFVFVNSVSFPDIPLNHEMKKSPEDVNLAIIGDAHIGSKHFLYDDFNKMIKWLKGEYGTESQREEAKKIKYLVLIGDVIDGVGIYPSQENDLEIKDVTEQFDKLTTYLKKIPSHIQIIISPGNHEPVRIAEPQPPLPKDFAKSLWELPNVRMVSNPAVVTVGVTENFSGIKLLLYHGFSFVYYADKVEPIRVKGGLERIDLILKLLLKKRHLGPSHTAIQYIPDERDDFLVIKTIPDIFITGHVHRTSINNYRNVTMVNSSTWVGMTDFQEKVGLKPMPSRVPIINLKTRKARIMKF